MDGVKFKPQVSTRDNNSNNPSEQEQDEDAEPAVHFGCEETAGPEPEGNNELLKLSIEVLDEEVETEVNNRSSAGQYDIPIQETMEELGVQGSQHQLTPGSIILSMKVDGLESMENLLQAKRNGDLEEHLGKLFLTPEVTKGKSVSLKVNIQNEDRLQILVDLKHSLYVKEASEASSSQSVRFTYCAERRKWFWTPYDKNHIWMEVIYESVQSGPRKGEIPEEKYLKIIRFLQKERPKVGLNSADCIICDLVSAGKKRKPDLTNGASGAQQPTIQEPEAGTCAKPASTAVGEHSDGQIPGYENNRLNSPQMNDTKFTGSYDSGKIPQPSQA